MTPRTWDGEESLDSWTLPTDPDSVSTVLLPDRYQDRGLIGRGGMGEVLRVFDEHLGCTLAMKILDARLSHHATARTRFINEARLTARLSHPGVVAVQDHGLLGDGRPWFTMTEVRGEPFSAQIDRGPLRRRVDVLMRVSGVVAYAHSVGVLHRDLKPANIMVGSFGEIYLMDWGLGRALTEAGEGPTLFQGDLPAGMTRLGQVVGTPAYMSPEQARGVELSTATDVYALGAILFHVLTGHPPHGRHWEPAPLDHLPDGPLAELAAHALAEDSTQRPARADAFMRALQQWSEGAQRRERAEAAMDRADAMRPAIDRRREHARVRRMRAQAGLAEVPSWTDAEVKSPWWAEEDAAESEEVAAEVEEVAWLRTVRSAIDEVPDLPRARQAMAEHYRLRLLEAERARDVRAAARFEALLSHWAPTTATGSLHLETTEPAEVFLAPLVLEARRWRPGDERCLGTTPVQTELHRGSYRLRLARVGRPDVICPVQIERGEHHGLGPDGEVHVQWLPEDIPEDEVFVPAGWFWSGGDRQATEPLPTRRLWVDDLFIQRHPVTVEHYRRFLTHRLQEGHEIQDWLPRSPHTRDGVLATLEDGRLLWDAPPRWPVTGVTWHAAMAYAAWWSERTGRSYSLPNELEWEKAARGCDGRAVAWGDWVEPSWARMLGSTEASPSPCPVDDYPHDVSVYGCRGMTGNVRDWCANVWTHEGPTVVEGRVLPDVASVEDSAVRVLKGGCWSTAAVHCRASGRFINRPDGTFRSLGFRLVRRRY